MRVEVELFETLSVSEKKQLYEISSLKKYTQGNILFYEGETPYKLHLLLDGILKVYKLDPKGNEVVLHFFQAQTLIAETAHMQKISYPATAVCETDALILEIDYPLFEKHFLRNPEISFKIIQSLSNKIKNLQSVITMNMTMGTLAKICKFFYENEKHLHELSHKKIAAILNITPETLSRNIALLKKKGIICVEKRKISIIDKKELLELKEE